MTALFFRRGDTGRRGGTVAWELRRQSGWRIWDLQRVWWVQKGKSPSSFCVCWVWVQLHKTSGNTSFMWCAGLCLLLALALPASPSSAVLLWKEHLRTLCDVTLWGTICYWLIISCIRKQSSVHIYIIHVLTPMLLNRKLHFASWYTVVITF